MEYWNYYRSQEPEDLDNEDTINEENLNGDDIQEDNSDRVEADNEDTDFYEGMEYMNRDDSSGFDYSDDSCGCHNEEYNYMDMMIPPCCPYRDYMFRELDEPPGPPSQQFGPGYGPPGPQHGPGYGPPGQQQGPGYGPPSGPPPHVTPNKAQAQHGAAPMAVEPGTLRRCRFRYIYIWPKRGRGFWAWLTFVGRRSIAGYRWSGSRWFYFGMDTRQIESFICY